MNGLTQKMSSTTKGTKKMLKKKTSIVNNKLISLQKSRRFKQKPEYRNVSISVKPHHRATIQLQFYCDATRLPVDPNYATTGQKPQGTTKYVVIITSWPMGGGGCKNTELTFPIQRNRHEQII